MNVQVLLTFFALEMVIMFAVWLSLRFGSTPVLVQQWARDHAHRILRCEYRVFATGPFRGRSLPRGSTVYRVQIEDLERHIRAAYIACIAEWGPGRTEVEWETE